MSARARARVCVYEYVHLCPLTYLSLIPTFLQYTITSCQS